MAKSMRSKREKRLRAIRREMVEPLYEKKEAAKIAAQEAALAAPKLPVRQPSAAAMDATPSLSNNIDVEMFDGSKSTASLKPVGGIGKKFKRKFKVGRGKRGGKGKGKIRKTHI